MLLMQFLQKQVIMLNPLCINHDLIKKLKTSDISAPVFQSPITVFQILFSQNIKGHLFKDTQTLQLLTLRSICSSWFLQKQVSNSNLETEYDKSAEKFQQFLIFFFLKIMYKDKHSTDSFLSISVKITETNIGN